MKKPPFQYGDFFYYCGRNDSAVYTPGPGSDTPKFFNKATMSSSASTTIRYLYHSNCSCNCAAVGTLYKYDISLDNSLYRIQCMMNSPSPIDAGQYTAAEGTSHQDKAASTWDTRDSGYVYGLHPAV